MSLLPTPDNTHDEFIQEKCYNQGVNSTPMNPHTNMRLCNGLCCYSDVNVVSHYQTHSPILLRPFCLVKFDSKFEFKTVVGVCINYARLMLT